MKLQPLFIALALAAGTSFAQMPAGAKGPADASPSPAAAVSPAPMKGEQGGKAGQKAMHEKHADQHGKKHHGNEHARKHHEEHMAQARHHEQQASERHHGEHHASAHHKGEHGTRMMGAGATGGGTDLHASARQDRIDQAYADWRARQR